jgi:hypothetical protein
MVLRIKELLYEDQYTIAGAKKRLTNELRGASKLKVVTPEMSAQASQAAPQLVPAHASPAEDEPRSYADIDTETHEHASAVEHAPEAELTEDRRDALRHLREHLRELLVLLEASDSHTPTRPRS